MLLVGLTGGIGAGKSTAAGLLAERGARIVDADQAARDVVEPGRPAHRALIERFGSGIVDADGRIDRSALAARAFASTEDRAALEAITHPAIHEELARRVAEAPPDSIVVTDVPLLVEAGGARAGAYDVVVVVEAPREVRLDRLERRGISRNDAAARMAAQATDEQRRAVATYVLDNGGDLATLETQVDRLWAELHRRADTTVEA